MESDWYVIYDAEGVPVQAFLRSNVNAVVRDVVYKNDCFVVAGGERIRFSGTDVKTVLADIFGFDVTKMPSR